MAWSAQGTIRGPQGATGAQGPQGNAGPTGNTGAQGPAGTAGAAGAQGPQGVQGAPGDAAVTRTVTINANSTLSAPNDGTTRSVWAITATGGPWTLTCLVTAGNFEVGAIVTTNVLTVPAGKTALLAAVKMPNGQWRLAGWDPGA